MFTYQYPHPAVTVDCVVFGLDGGTLQVLLIERGLEPYRGTWALPGGFIKMDEDLETAARRELKEEAGVTELYLEQLGAYGSPGRDPRERVITVAWVAIVNRLDHRLQADTDARAADWFPVDKLPPLAFDHAQIVADGLAKVRSQLRYHPIGFEFLPKKFTLTQVQRLYETIGGRTLDKRNFRKKILATGLLVGLDEVETGVAHRAAQLFTFDAATYARMQTEGYGFEI